MKMKLPNYLYLSIVCLFLLSNCDSINICYHGNGICNKLRTRKPIDPKFAVFPVPKESSKCECPNADSFNLKNEGGSGSVDIITISRQPSDTMVHEERSSLTLKGGETIQWFCSVQPTVSTKQCDISVVKLINGQPYGGDIGSIMKGIIKSNAKADMEQMDHLPTPNGDCPQKCKNSTHCTIFDVSKSKSVNLGQEIALLLGAPRSIIENAKIVDLTKSKTNVCQRSDVIFDNEDAYNVGLTDGCQIQTNLPSTLGEMSITIPRTFAFRHNLSPSQNGNFRLNFDLKQAALDLTFENPTLQKILGGSLLEVDYYAGTFAFEMQSHACFSVQIK